jgi:ribosome-associated toxin RatA of RatAB toxin-antitoxin module
MLRPSWFETKSPSPHGCARHAPLRSASLLGFAALIAMLALGCAGGGTEQPRSPSGGSAEPGPSEVPSSMFEATAVPPSAPAAASDGPVRSEALPIPGSDLVRGRATATVNAPIAKTRDVLLDFERYPEFMPEFSGGKILGRTRDGTQDVYQEMKILKGTVRIWARIQIPKAPVVDGVEIYAGRFVEGNLEAYEPTWKLRAIDDTHTEVTAEFFLKPKFFVPTSWMNNKNVQGTTEAVRALKRRVEGTPPPP